MTRALMDTTEQGNVLKTQPSSIKCLRYNNQMPRSLRAQTQSEGAHPASVDTMPTRIVGFTGELDQKLKKLTEHQVIDMIKSKPEIMPPEWAQDLAMEPKQDKQSTAFVPFLNKLQKQTVNARIATITIPFPIFWTIKTKPDPADLILGYPTTESVFTNDDPNVNTNK
ncbi:MAG: hypothetical protein EZS28_019976 [Streblomastix strix]|uniref:Uncharacterized protein n=1 Tax=Streblomastix strix TaxID=222440 RepID=A0A5J4VQG3_9EUKA|nr:MAG: hypothetical protein EZS28_019976 [Streblomastix strix]